MHYVHIGFKYIQDNEMIELANATIRRTLSFEDPYLIWLLALLSSQQSCNSSVYNVVPLIVDYLYENNTNNFTFYYSMYKNIGQYCARNIRTIGKTSIRKSKIFPIRFRDIDQIWVNTLLSSRKISMVLDSFNRS